MIYRSAPILMNLNRIKVTPVFDAGYIMNGIHAQKRY